jgi:5-formyltetrahydrofolate cyclo-ligase
MLTGWRKSRLRAKAKTARAKAHGETPDAAARLVEHFPDEIWPALNSVVAGYRPLGDEIDPTRLLETFHCEQARIALPCVEDDAAPLVFRAYSPGDPLEPGRYGVEAPPRSATALTPSLVLLPLLAFDTAGRRLGYGGGYYDRTLEKLRAQGPVIAAGLAFEAQRVGRVPSDARDQRLDWIITEQGAYRVPVKPR